MACIRFTPAIGAWRPGSPVSLGDKLCSRVSILIITPCSCGNTFVTKSTAKGDHMTVDVCSKCHPFYTGKQKILDTGGRVARFEKRYGKKSN